MGLPVRTPVRLRTDQQAQADFAALELDAAIVAAYGLILPQSMLEAPKRGCLNIHASLLPRWRGAGPIQAAILAGDVETGITIMQMDAGLDTGAMLISQAIPITTTTTSASLHDQLADIGADLIVRVLAAPPTPNPQPAEGATYAPKLTRNDGRIDWTKPADDIDRQIRAFDPWPGTFTALGGSALKVLAAVPAEGSGAPGTVLDTSFTVACGDGAVRLTRLQMPGRSAQPADAFLRGHPVLPGTVLGS
jgi:methionyl-tRNA formyltransferase